MSNKVAVSQDWNTDRACCRRDLLAGAGNKRRSAGLGGWLTGHTLRVPE